METEDIILNLERYVCIKVESVYYRSKEEGVVWVRCPPPIVSGIWMLGPSSQGYLERLCKHGFAGGSMSLEAGFETLRLTPFLVCFFYIVFAIQDGSPQLPAPATSSLCIRTSDPAEP